MVKHASDEQCLVSKKPTTMEKRGYMAVGVGEGSSLGVW
jgi:hypothetical protein